MHSLARSIDRLSSIESYAVKRPGPSAIHQRHFFLIESRVTRFGEISPLWQNSESLWQFFEWLLNSLPNCEPMTANVLSYRVNFHS